MPQLKRLANRDEHEAFLRSCQRSDKLRPGLNLTKLAEQIYATQQIIDFYLQPKKRLRRSPRIAQRNSDAKEEADTSNVAETNK